MSHTSLMKPLAHQSEGCRNLIGNIVNNTCCICRFSICMLSMTTSRWPLNDYVHKHFPSLTSSRIIPFDYIFPPALQSKHSCSSDLQILPLENPTLQGSHWYFSVFSLAIIPIPIFVVDRWRNCSATSESAKPLQWLPKTTGWRTALALSRCAAQKDPFLQLRLLFLN